MSHPAAAECQDQSCRRPSLTHSRLYLLGASTHGRSDRTSSNPPERVEHPRGLGLRLGCTDSTYSPPGPAAGQACLAKCFASADRVFALRPKPGNRDDRAQANRGREECDPTPAAAHFDWMFFGTKLSRVCIEVPRTSPTNQWRAAVDWNHLPSRCSASSDLLTRAKRQRNDGSYQASRSRRRHPVVDLGYLPSCRTVWERPR